MASAPGSKTGRSGKGGPSHNEGDWICSDKNCANINFSWRANCNKCGKEKGKVDVIKKTGAEIGKQAAARSGGLFSAEDWQCSVCANVNWARRSECNLCHTPKFNISEARTGAGGGYNERENVEYKERDESDDEYDEFGRKKKKFRQKSNGSRQSTTITYELEKGKAEILDLSRVPLATSIATTAAAEEEEDEEDDDEDVSKYDLMAGSDDETPPTSGTKGTGPQSRNSHSRSPKHRRVSSRSQSSRSRSRSPGGGSRARRRGGARSRSPSPRQRRRSRSSSRSRNRRRTSSRSRSRSPHRRRSGGSKDRGRRQSRSRSRSRDRRRRSHSRSRSRSRSRDRRRSYRSRSRSRDRDSYR